MFYLVDINRACCFKNVRNQILEVQNAIEKVLSDIVYELIEVMKCSSNF